MKKQTGEKGITLIALIITIIVMLILVSVSITITVNNGLFKAAQGAARSTNEAKEAELALANEQVNIGVGGEAGTYNTLDEYVMAVTGQGGSSGSTYTAYSVGDLVTLGTGANAEDFYVIADSDENESTVLLLTAMNVETENFTQSASANTVAFDEGYYDDVYWADYVKPDGNTPATEQYENASISSLVASYKSALEARTGITVVGARLIEREELHALGAGGSSADFDCWDSTAGCTGSAAFVNTSSFWTGTSYFHCHVFWVNNSEPGLYLYGVTTGTVAGLRPVIEVSKSNI